VVRLGQFIGMAITTAGLVALFLGLDARNGSELWLNRLGLLSAGVAIGVMRFSRRWTAWP